MDGADTGTTLLVVEDETAIRDMLAFTLTTAGFRVEEAANAEQAWQQLQQSRPDLMLLDWMLPGMSGMQLLQRLRQDPALRTLPVVMLTARGSEMDQVEGFEAGADDYVVKPFSPRALVARVQALLRRQRGEGTRREQIRIGPLELDLSGHRVECDGREISLGPTEFRLLAFFMQHPDRVFSRAQLLDHVWGAHVVVEERTVDVHIRRLRKALSDQQCDGMIQTVRGAGYRFSARTDA